MPPGHIGVRARGNEIGDVAATVVARLMGFDSVRDFEFALPSLISRRFPTPDETTGRYCLEAVHRWRRLRHPNLFPELTAAPAALHAESVFHERLARIGKN